MPPSDIMIEFTPASGQYRTDPLSPPSAPAAGSPTARASCRNTKAHDDQVALNAIELGNSRKQPPAPKPETFEQA